MISLVTDDAAFSAKRSRVYLITIIFEHKEVKRLIVPEVLVEIEADAVIDDQETSK